jgi:hypothetical protein
LFAFSWFWPPCIRYVGWYWLGDGVAVSCHVGFCVRLCSIGVGRRGLDVNVAVIGREGVGWYWPGDGVAVGRRVGCRIRLRSIGMSTVLDPKQCRQELAVKGVKGSFASSRTWRVSRITCLPSRCLLAPNPHAHLKSFGNWPKSINIELVALVP